MDIALPVPGYLDNFTKRVIGTLAAEAEEWSGCLNALSRWEDEKLIDDPTPERLAEHKQIVEAMLRLGGILQFATKNPDYPDRATADLVEATMQGLKDALAMHHGPHLNEARREEILAACFRDEPAA